jgi:hypothetical protein
LFPEPDYLRQSTPISEDQAEVVLLTADIETQEDQVEHERGNIMSDLNKDVGISIGSVSVA